MNAQSLKVFTNGLSNYFMETTRTPAEVGTPYLLDEEIPPMAQDFFSIIGISGDFKGEVYFLMSSGLAVKLMKRTGETDFSDSLCADYVGEIANTIAGNAQLLLGGGFMISAPTVVKGSISLVRLPRNIPTFVIPIKWGDMLSYLILAIK